jgi:hypothetical protein
VLAARIVRANWTGEVISTLNLLGHSVMQASLMAEVTVLEALISAGAAAVEKLDSLIHVEAPGASKLFSSDCCGSNNYPDQQG